METEPSAIHPRFARAKYIIVLPYTWSLACEDVCYTAPKLWNSLPLHLRLCDSLVSFKAGLKTFLFKRAFGL